MTAPSGGGSTVALRAGGVLVAVEVPEQGLPQVLHWGADLPADSVASLALLREGALPNSALDDPWQLTVLPTQSDGWLGTPALEAHLAGSSVAPGWRVRSSAPNPHTLEVLAEASEIAVSVTYALDQQGILTVRVAATNYADGGRVLDLAAVRAILPLPARASEILDLTGRWCRERSPQRADLLEGTHRRASRRGRTGHDATLLLSVGTPGFGFRDGEVWSVHVAWSGNHEHFAERPPEGAGMHAAVIGGGEQLASGEIRLGAGETYTAPDVHFVYSAEGLDGISRRLHRRLRSDAPLPPRPLVLNTWEAVYFEHDLERLKHLADTAAEIGVERFVLDDGWFGSRRDDSSGLGDWYVSDDVWPDGLTPLVEHVKHLGMQFGLWFEPEMLNLDSDLARQHPDWILRPREGLPPAWRRQQVLDLANPEAAAHIESRIDDLVRRYGIDFIKWDHNRDLHQAVRTDAGGQDRPAVHVQTRALYALLDRLRSRHPALEIESCASGGARVDLGILERTDRVWASDCNDPLERAQIQRWTSLLVPPERMGTHIGPHTAHTTHRTTDLGFRMLMALQGHAGIEWDITSCSDGERQQLAAWSRLYRELRPLLHGGDLVRADTAAQTLLLSGMVSEDRSEAAFTVAQLSTALSATPGLVPLPGLDPARRYTVRVRPEAGLPQTTQLKAPMWWDAAVRDGVVLHGSVLGNVGLPLPVLAPAQGFLLHLISDA